MTVKIITPEYAAYKWDCRVRQEYINQGLEISIPTFQQWLKYKENFKLKHAEYIDKTKKIK